MRKDQVRLTRSRYMYARFVEPLPMTSFPQRRTFLENLRSEYLPICRHKSHKTDHIPMDLPDIFLLEESQYTHNASQHNFISL